LVNGYLPTKQTRPKAEGAAIGSFGLHFFMPQCGPYRRRRRRTLWFLK